MLECLVEEGILPSSDKIWLDTQPANSPDLNINDLGFFNALQALYYRSCPKDALDLIQKVQEAHQKYPASKINHLFLPLQGCMNMIVEQNGSNHYEIPHLSKEKLERAGNLPLALEISPIFSAMMSLMASEADFGAAPGPTDRLRDDFMAQAEPLPGRITRADFENLLETSDENNEN